MQVRLTYAETAVLRVIQIVSKHKPMNGRTRYTHCLVFASPTSALRTLTLMKVHNLPKIVTKNDFPRLGVEPGSLNPKANTLPTEPSRPLARCMRKDIRRTGNSYIGLR